MFYKGTKIGVEMKIPRDVSQNLWHVSPDSVKEINKVAYKD